jgi:hypothetical protein
MRTTGISSLHCIERRYRCGSTCMIAGTTMIIFHILVTAKIHTFSTVLGCLDYNVDSDMPWIRYATTARNKIIYIESPYKWQLALSLERRQVINLSLTSRHSTRFDPNLRFTWKGMSGWEMHGIRLFLGYDGDPFYPASRRIFYNCYA